MFEFTICPKCGYKPIESEIAESKKKMEEFAKTNYSLFKKEQVSKPKFNVNKQWKIFFVV